MDDHLNISSVLAFSEQQEALIAAQQQVTQRVMDNNKILRDSLQQEHDEAERYKQLYEAELAKNKQNLRKPLGPVYSRNIMRISCSMKRSILIIKDKW